MIIGTKVSIVMPKLLKENKKKDSLCDRAKSAFDKLRKDSNRGWTNCVGHYTMIPNGHGQLVLFDGMLNQHGEFEKSYAGVINARLAAISNSYKVMGIGLDGFGGHIFDFELKG